ncbi:MAG: hypothetical protein WB543_11445 [Candidatus Acidiferrum sp.]
MSTASPRHRTSLSLPRDFIHRRRFRRRLTNFILIPLLSALAAYAITRPTGGGGFTLPKPAQQKSVSAASSHESEVLATAAVSAHSSSADTIANPDVTTPVASPAAPMLGGTYMLDNGPHAVTEVQDIVLHDAKRNKDLHLRIFYPNEPGPYPVIIFSAGEGSSPFCCDALTRHWASYGYVTLQPTHDDSTVRPRTGGEQNNNSLKAVRNALEEPALWESRPRDISFVLDSLPALQNRIPALSGKIDADRIGVGGHSLGAFTADAVAGALVDLPRHPAVSFADRRVKSVLLLSPQGPGEFGLTSHSWDHVSVPLLSMTGSRDLGVDKQSPEWREIPFERSQPGDKYQVYIQGADHASFITAKTLRGGRAALGESILGYTNSASLAFWDAYLKADPKAKIYLQSSALPDFSHGAVKLSRR